MKPRRLGGLSALILAAAYVAGAARIPWRRPKHGADSRQVPAHDERVEIRSVR